jgi:hypothetical protein
MALAAMMMGTVSLFFETAAVARHALWNRRCAKSS